MIAISQPKAQLETRLAELKARLDGIENELDGHNSPDWEELATER